MVPIGFGYRGLDGMRNRSSRPVSRAIAAGDSTAPETRGLGGGADVGLRGAQFFQGAPRATAIAVSHPRVNASLRRRIGSSFSLLAAARQLRHFVGVAGRGVASVARGFIR